VQPAPSLNKTRNSLRRVRHEVRRQADRPAQAAATIAPGAFHKPAAPARDKDRLALVAVSLAGASGLCRTGFPARHPRQQAPRAASGYAHSWSECAPQGRQIDSWLVREHTDFGCSRACEVAWRHPLHHPTLPLHDRRVRRLGAKPPGNRAPWLEGAFGQRFGWWRE
jgi:hypothetical protein